MDNTQSLKEENWVFTAQISIFPSLQNSLKSVFVHERDSW
jgi:hypothetical protein